MSIYIQVNSLRCPVRAKLKHLPSVFDLHLEKIPVLSSSLHRASSRGEVKLIPSLSPSFAERFSNNDGLILKSGATESILEETALLARDLSVRGITEIGFHQEAEDRIAGILKELVRSANPKEEIAGGKLGAVVLREAPQLNSPVFNLVKVAPSLLAADFGRLGEELKLIENSGADLIHFDVMDGNFVPNISFGITVLESVKKYSSLPFDVHLMVSHPHRNELIEKFARAGANVISFSAEKVTDMNQAPDLRGEAEIRDMITRISGRGVVPALVLNPRTPVEFVRPYLNQLGMVLLMTVWPGYGGQKFIEDVHISSLERVGELRRMIDAVKSPAVIEIDGGINCETGEQVRKAGADILVAGTYLFSDRGLIGTKVRCLRGEVISP